uniref:Uncharacterized protein n=1 Tax=Oryza meridionalis TaxID=40149 RepID=A0A0E0EKJ0_9ORYZ
MGLLDGESAPLKGDVRKLKPLPPSVIGEQQLGHSDGCGTATTAARHSNNGSSGLSVLNDLSKEVGEGVLRHH